MEDPKENQTIESTAKKDKKKEENRQENRQKTQDARKSLKFRFFRFIFLTVLLIACLICTYFLDKELDNYKKQETEVLQV